MRLQNYLYNHIYKYPTQTGLNYMWTFGSLLSFLIVIQLISGIFIACYYIPVDEFALKSILFLVNEVTGGWLAYRIHVIGSSCIFMALYGHLFRGFYYKLYNWENRFSWWSGYLLFLLMMGVAFFGYILPWGQMSYWAATVIINMATIIPYLGSWLTTFIWGGNVVNAYTLQRLFILHMVLAFVVVSLIAVHISVIHNSSRGSQQALALRSTVQEHIKQNLVVKGSDILLKNLYPLYLIKDTFIVLISSCIILFISIYYPEYFSNYINWIVSNPKVTPSHIIPEWYFLPFYGVVKLIPSKLIGVIFMVIIILIPFLLPYSTKKFIH